ncbi:MAG: hypothetical protein ACRCW4_00265 [Candidatus Neomicrothrix subdominans]
MSRPWEDIHATVLRRRERNSPIIDEMIVVRDRYNGDYVLPYLTDADAAGLPPLTPAIIADAIDNNGMLAGSTLPSITCPPVNPTKQTGVRSREYAKTRAGIIKGTLFESRFQLQMRRAYRHLFGYASFCMSVIPDMRYDKPRVHLRDPLTCYPDERAAEDFCDPENVAFVYGKSVDWIRSAFPEARDFIQSEARGGDNMWEMVEWVDEHDVVVGILGPREKAQYYTYSDSPLRWGKELRRWPNRAGMVTAICPARVTLDRISSQLVKVTGITDLMARMMALDVLAREKSIFPDRFLLGRTGMTPQIVNGEWKDGRTGEMNVVLDAEKIGSMTFAPDPSSTQMVDRLERNARISGGLVPQMGGESYGALRTGRGMDALMGAAVDPRIQEMQEIMAAHLPRLNEAIFETYKGYWPTKKFTLLSGWNGTGRQVEFTPAEHIETSSSVVSYSIAGADAQGKTIILGQMFGTGAISLRTFREKHPWIDDPDEEAARVDEEKFERVAVESILQRAMGGMMAPIELADLEEARRTDPNGDIFTAIRAADQRARERQAQIAPEPGPGQVTAPEAQPGLGGPTAQPAPPPGLGASIGPTEEMQGLRELMNAVSATNRRV